MEASALFIRLLTLTPERAWGEDPFVLAVPDETPVGQVAYVSMKAPGRAEYDGTEAETYLYLTVAYVVVCTVAIHVFDQSLEIDLPQLTQAHRRND